MAVRAPRRVSLADETESPPRLPRTPAPMPVFIPTPRDGGEHENQPSQSRRNIVPPPRYFPPTGRHHDERQTPRHPPPRAVSNPCRTTAVYQRNHPPGSRSPRQLVQPPRRQSQTPLNCTVGGIAVTRGPRASISTRANPVAPSPAAARQGVDNRSGVAAPTTCVRCGRGSVP